MPSIGHHNDHQNEASDLYPNFIRPTLCSQPIHLINCPLVLQEEGRLTSDPSRNQSPGLYLTSCTHLHHCYCILFLEIMTHIWVAHKWSCCYFWSNSRCNANASSHDLWLLLPCKFKWQLKFLFHYLFPLSRFMRAWGCWALEAQGSDGIPWGSRCNISKWVVTAHCSFGRVGNCRPPPILQVL
jgi:hypothetical protein